MLLTFFLVTIGWIIFRAENIEQAWEYLNGMIQFGTLRASYRFFTLPEIRFCTISVVLMLIVEWLERGNKGYFSGVLFKSRFIRWSFYVILGLIIFFFRQDSNAFIYFQF